MNYLRTLFLSFLVLIIAGRAAGEIIFPPPFYSTGQSSLPVMIYSGKGDPLSISLTGPSGQEEKIDFAAGFSTVEFDLDPGKNILKWGDEILEIYHLSEGAEAPEGFSRAFLHEAMDDCGNCHDVEKGVELLNEVPGVCYECHDDVSEGSDGTYGVIHSPVEDGDCLSCHPPHHSPEEGLLAISVPLLCEDCHDRVNAGETEEPFPYQHDPVDAGDCFDCHQIHASNFGALLVSPAGSLCFDCHDDPSVNEEGEKKSSLHEPVSERDCSACHEVHGSDSPTLLASPGDTLCQECHEYPTTGEDGERFIFVHGPADSGECLSCHDAHASDFPSFIRIESSDLCLECHDDPKADPGGNEYDYIHDALGEGCLVCHGAHGSNYQYFLLISSPELCFECHDNVRTNGDGIEFKFGHQPVYDGQCSDCHNPHGSVFAALLQEAGNPLCQKCHFEYHHSHREVAEGMMTRIPQNFPVDKSSGNLACSGCHDVHGSDNEFLFDVERVMLCTVCHRI